MATISNTPRPGYAWDATDNVWYPIGTGPHTHADYITSSSAINPTIVDAKGDIIAATAADTVARLAVGANGTVLTAASGQATGLEWATPSSGALTKINTTSFSAVSSVSLPANTFSATYNHYKILFIVSTVSAGGNFNARLRAAGTDDTSSVYEASNIAADYGSNGLNNNSSGSTQTSWTTFSYTESSNPTYLTAEIFNPFASVRTGFVQTSVMGTTTTFTGGGKFASTTSFDSMTFIKPSGTMTGTVTVYGYQI